MCSTLLSLSYTSLPTEEKEETGMLLHNAILRLILYHGSVFCTHTPLPMIFSLSPHVEKEETKEEQEQQEETKEEAQEPGNIIISYTPDGPPLLVSHT